MSNELKEFKDGGKRLGRLLWTGGRKRKVATVIVGAFVALVVISGIVGDQGKDNKGGAALPPAADAEPTNTAEATATARATDTPEPTDTPKPTKTPEPTDTPKPTKTPKPTDTPKPTWETGPVTEQTVRDALDDLDDLGLVRPDIDADNVTFLSVIGDLDGEGYIVAIEFKPGPVLSETDFLTVAGESTLITMAKLFANPQVHRVKISAMADLIDALGNDSTEFLTSATINRPTADRINWQGLADRQLFDNKHIFCIADEYIIRPLIYNELRDTGCLRGPSHSEG